MLLNINNNEFEILINGVQVIKHTAKNPFIFIGKGEANYDMYRGNFKIKDYLEERVALKKFEIVKNEENNVEINLFDQDELKLTLVGKEEEGRLKIYFNSKKEENNRIWIRVVAEEDEKIYGCGEQLSYFNLRDKNFPLWTSEPGVGRNKNTYTTWQADVKDMAGGDYYNTNYPQPTFVSTRKYYCHLESTAYLDFDFRNKKFHELQCWDIPKFIMFETGKTFLDIQEKLTRYFGRQPKLPEWIYNGVMLGLQGGTEKVLDKLNKALDSGIKVSSVWCQDWQGKRITSFGKRLNWNWKWSPEEYPNLDVEIKKLKERGIKFLGYINPYVIEGYDLYEEAKAHGYLATKIDGSDYTVDFGEFYCGVVDFTNPAACEWYKGVIKTNLIDFGLDGWMADFGEYLPTDCQLSNGMSAEVMHNAWPAMWAKINYEAVKEAGKLEEIVYFMRAGFTGTQKYCTLIWAGDQSVDFSLDDGLASVIPAALSVGMSGNGLSHSDIGGYTSLHGNKRNRELLLRWTEMAAFTPVMRTHEGNRPDDNYQHDGDIGTMKFFARMTDVYTSLKPYMQTLVEQNANFGIPVQRPMFFHYEKDLRTYDIKYQYLLGEDLLVAPVHQEYMDKWSVYLPEDNWVHLWTGEEYKGGDIEVLSKLGYPPVFYRKNSKWSSLFKEIGAK
ncbi:alpha-glucosidase [Cetobacterium sp.]|uniref:alpha-glucosidase n=1 Tax=Cetobacterium sp. TaxID=2071632 RepID=UPI003F375A58